MIGVKTPVAKIMSFGKEKSIRRENTEDRFPNPNGNRKQRRAAKKIMQKTTK